MNEKILFSERQKFKQIWLWAIILSALVIPMVIFIVGLIKQLSLGIPFGNNPMSDAGLILFCVAYFVFTVGMVAFFLVQRLETEITTEGVKVRFFPIHRTFRTYKWEDISNAFVRKYSPIMEFGGWGIRFGNRRNGSAYNVSGNQGLQLEFKKGKKLLIGTQNPYEIERALKKIEQIKNENQLNKQ